MSQVIPGTKGTSGTWTWLYSWLLAGTPWNVPGNPRNVMDVRDMGPGIVAGSIDETSWDVPGNPRNSRDMGPGCIAGF